MHWMGEDWFSKENPGAVIRRGMDAEEANAEDSPYASASQLDCTRITWALLKHTSWFGRWGLRVCISNGSRMVDNAAGPHTGHTQSGWALCPISKFTSSHPITGFLWSPPCTEVPDYANLFLLLLPPTPLPMVPNAPKHQCRLFGNHSSTYADSAARSPLEKLSTVSFCDLYMKIHIIKSLLY